MKYILVVSLAIFLASCGKNMDRSSVSSSALSAPPTTLNFPPPRDFEEFKARVAQAQFYTPIGLNFIQTNFIESARVPGTTKFLFWNLDTFKDQKTGEFKNTYVVSTGALTHKLGVTSYDALRAKLSEIVNGAVQYQPCFAGQTYCYGVMTQARVWYGIDLRYHMTSNPVSASFPPVDASTYGSGYLCESTVAR